MQLGLGGASMRGTRITAATFTAILLVGPIATAIAQQEALQPGVRVRVTVPDLGIENVSGILTELSGDTLALERLRAPLASVTRLEVYRGRRWRTGRGAFIGLVAGGISGGVALGVVCASIRGGYFGCTVPQGVVYGGLAGGVLGAGLGALIGLAISGEKWEEVSLNELRVTLVPQRDGFGLGISVAF